MNTKKEFFVSPSGSDSANGSKDAPFLTIERAHEELRDTTSDIVINLLPGIHKITKTLKFDSDVASKNRTVTYKGNDATIFGGIMVTSWEKHDDKIYKARLDVDDARNLYVNTFPATRARSKYSYLLDTLVKEGDVAVGFKISGRNFPKGFTNVKDLEIVNPWEWECHRFHLTDYSYDAEKNEHTFLLDVENAPIRRLGKESRKFYLENDFSLLDEPGEFFFDKREKVIYYYPYPEEDLSTATCYVGEKEMFVNILGENMENRASNVTFDGIRFAGGACRTISKYGYLSHQSDAILADKHTHSSDLPENEGFNVNTSQFRMENADNITFKNCEFINMGSAIIAMNHSVSNVVIEGNIFRDSSANAIRVGNPSHRYEAEGIDLCRNILIKNNVIARPCGEILSNCGISVYYENGVKILHNFIEDTPYTSVTLSWGWEGAVGYDCRDLEVGYNRIIHPMSILSDGGGIYTLGEIKNGRLHDNYIVGSRDRGIYNDAGAAQTSTYNNIFIDCSLPFYIQDTKYKTNNLNMYHNFSTSTRIAVPTNLDSIKTETPILIDKNNLTGEAKDIFEKSGLTPEYAHLLEKAAIPAWHGKRSATIVPVYKCKKDAELDRVLSYVYAKDFMEGGEGVAYHKTFKPSKGNNSYRPNDEVCLYFNSNIQNHVVHMVDIGEWLKYEVEIPKTDKYFVEIATCAIGLSENSIMKVYIDDVLLTDYLPTVEKVGYHTMARSPEPLKIEKGKHIVKIEYIIPCYFDKFRFYTGKEAPIDEKYFASTDVDYKDGNY